MIETDRHSYEPIDLEAQDIFGDPVTSISTRSPDDGVTENLQAWVPLLDKVGKSRAVTVML